MNNEKLFLNVEDVSDIMRISIPRAYKVIAQLNNQLSSEGYLTIAGKISKKFFDEKVYIEG